MREITSMLLIALWFLLGATAYASTGANLNLVLLTDLSGSMKSNHLVVPVQGFLGEFVDEVYTGDRVIMASFGTEIWVDRPINVSDTNRPNDLADLHFIVDGFDFSQNWTYTSGGLFDACTVLQQQKGPKGLVLLTDGKEEIPRGLTARWDDLDAACDGVAIHVVALTAVSKPTVDKVGTRLGATVHDATVDSLAVIGERIRSGIRVFVAADQQSFELGNLKLGGSAEIRTSFSVTGASSSIQLTPEGNFPEGVELDCDLFTAPGDLRCQIRLANDLEPGTYGGKIIFRATGNLAVVTPTLEVNFTKDMLRVRLSQESINVGALRPGETGSVHVKFEADDTVAEAKQVEVNLVGLPDDVHITVTPDTIAVPNQHGVDIRFTLDSAPPGSYEGQLTFQAPATVALDPVVVPVSVKRRGWYMENWKHTLPSTVLLLFLLCVLYYRLVVRPRQKELNKPLLKGRLEFPDGSVIRLKTDQQEQIIDGFTFRATGKKKQSRINILTTDTVRVRVAGAERYVAPNIPVKMVDGAEVLADDGSVFFTFRCMGLR
ncbi:MAG: VWA domain-containing protein [bacterium]|nr:VWA domain-containing protein [bacterium]